MPGLGRAISDTCNGEKEKCEAGVGVSCQKLLEPSCDLCYKCSRVSCLMTI